MRIATGGMDGNRTGFTILELVVTLSVLAVLFALLLPAVQQARAVSRQMACRNNLRQIGIAMHSRHEQFGVFVSHYYRRELLPFVDQSALAAAFEGREIDITGGASETGLSRNPTIAGVSLAVYACPADGVQSLARGRISSYPLNIGTGFRDFDDGFIRSGAATGAADMTDGLSNTVAFSEKLLFTSADYPDLPSPASRRTYEQRLRASATTDSYHETTRMTTFADACDRTALWLPAPPMGSTFFVFGTEWPGGYNHIMAPNHLSCFNGVAGESNESNKRYSAVTATSLHSGGVNVLLGDGSCRFVSEHINRGVWQAVGTRNSGEVISEF